MPDPTHADDLEPRVEPPEPEPSPESAEPAEKPEQGQFVQRWTFVLALAGVWIPAAGIGLGLYYWWYYDHSLHKTTPVFAVLIFVVLCTVSAIIIATVSKKPLIAAIAIALMSAPYAAIVAAAPLYGANYCEVRKAIDPTSQCLVGIIPY